MHIRQVKISRFRGIREATLHPGSRTVLLGPNNAAKSTLLEALDLVLHPGFGRPRRPPDELDYYARDPAQGFEIEVVLGALDPSFLAEARDHLEGWNRETRELDPDPDGVDCEPAARVRVTGSSDFDLTHEFAKPESQGARFGPRLRRQVAWLFDGRTRDPAWQMVFHRGGVLDRLFDDSELSPALDQVRAGLRQGAKGFSGDAVVLAVLAQLGEDLRELQIEAEGLPEFELGGVSERELLQTLRLALPVLPDVTIPLRRQGRGVQRLLLVAALLRLARQPGTPPPIGAFEEPEEALEPVRQAQMAAMIKGVADEGGQVFVVTHSVDMVRSFALDDLHLVSDRQRGQSLSLRDTLDEQAKQGYERRLDGPIVQALFTRVPVLVEGPSDRACFMVFWDALADAEEVKPRYARAIDFVNCEGASHEPEIARLLSDAEKPVVAWAELDAPDELKRLREGGKCAAFALYPDDPERHNLEAELSAQCSIEALAKAMELVAEIRGYNWDEQRADLLNRCEDATDDQREAMRQTSGVRELLDVLPEALARRLVRAALGARRVSPFEMKGARPARLVAETIVAVEGVPAPYARVMKELDAWIHEGCRVDGREFGMGDSRDAP